jgi:hypothetical protein
MRRQLYKTEAEQQAWLKAYAYSNVAEMQAEYRLAPTGIVDAQTVNAMLVPRCGNPTMRRGGGATQLKLPTNRPKVFFQDFIKVDFTQDTFVTEVLRGMNLWSVVCNLQFQRTSKISEANIVVKTEVIDGPGETLAYAYFPSGTKLQLPCVFGEEEAWDKPWGISLFSTSCHEGAHNSGVDHDPTSKGVMAAFYDPKVLVPTSAWEIKQMVDRYGNPALTPVTPPTADVEEMIQIYVTGSNLKVKGFERVKK